MSAGDAEAIVLAAGAGERLGLGPKAWLQLGGRTLLERAVETMRLVTDRLVVGVAAGDVERAQALCGHGVTVVAGGATHRGTMLAALRAARAPLVLIHDVAHPFVTPALAREVLARARARGAAVAAVAARSSAYHWSQGGARARLGPGELWLVRRPFACRRAELTEALAAAADEDARGRPAEGLSVLLERAGVATEIVPAPSWHIKVTTVDDWALAEAIERGLRPV
jgi:2-C-methyl-D-erythritol 4-phosphate cytidylyltransferase